LQLWPLGVFPGVCEKNPCRCAIPAAK
jgi:hypothetical protein